MCFFMFLLGLPMCTEGGVYLFQLMDFYSASGMSLLWVCFFQTITIGWFFGTDKFCDAVEQMTGTKPGKFWYLCWKFLAPAVMLVSNIFLIQCSVEGGSLESQAIGRLRFCQSLIEL